MSKLSQKKCIPCQGGIPPMPREEAEEMLKHVNGWSLTKDSLQIEKQFQFKDFKEAMAFINQVAGIAESEGHHPDIFVSYNKVKITIYTHKINGLHENDFILAAKIDKTDPKT